MADMTMLNTISNLGGQWPGPVVLALKSSVEKVPSLDSFGIVCCVCTVLGLAWVVVFQKMVHELQERPKEAWDFGASRTPFSRRPLRLLVASSLRRL